MRYSTYLRQRYRAIVGYTGLIGLIAGLGILAPLIALIAYPEERAIAWGFLLPGVLLCLLGGLLWLFIPKETVSLTLQEGAVVVVLGWLLAVVFGAAPFMLIDGLTLTQAVFEATSGWTTTGLSVVDVTQTSRLILLYRSTTELLGGAGLAIITLSALTGPAGSGLSAAEGRSEQLTPHVRQSAKLVLMIYSGYVVVGIVALWLAGMGWFDAVNHSFAALSTGGFSTRPDSIGYWDSPAVEAVTVVLMILGGLNFVTSYLLLTGKFKAVMRNGQVRLQAIVIPLCILILLLGVVPLVHPEWGKAVRVAVFETVTALSTTGLSTVGYTDWNSLGMIVFIGLMLIGGGAGSTAGGIKQLRIYILFRSLLWELKRMLLPQQAVSEPHIWQSEQRKFLSDEQIRQVGVFVFLYLVTFLIGSAIVAAYGYTLQEALFEFASTMGTVGLSVGVTAADAPIGMLWTQIVGMFLGRLEFFTVFVGVIRLIKDFPVAVSPG